MGRRRPRRRDAIAAAGGGATFWLLFAWTELAHHDGAKSRADRQCRNGLRLTFQDEQQCGDRSRGDDRRAQREVFPVEFFHVRVCGVGRAAPIV